MYWLLLIILSFLGLHQEHAFAGLKPKPKFVQLKLGLSKEEIEAKSNKEILEDFEEILNAQNIGQSENIILQDLRSYYRGLKQNTFKELAGWNKELAPIAEEKLAVFSNPNLLNRLREALTTKHLDKDADIARAWKELCQPDTDWSQKHIQDLLTKASGKVESESSQAFEILAELKPSNSFQQTLEKNIPTLFEKSQNPPEAARLVSRFPELHKKELKKQLDSENYQTAAYLIKAGQLTLSPNELENLTSKLPKLDLKDPKFDEVVELYLSLKGPQRTKHYPMIKAFLKENSALGGEGNLSNEASSYRSQYHTLINYLAGKQPLNREEVEEILQIQKANSRHISELDALENIPAYGMLLKEALIQDLVKNGSSFDLRSLNRVHLNQSAIEDIKKALATKKDWDETKTNDLLKQIFKHVRVFTTSPTLSQSGLIPNSNERNLFDNLYSKLDYAAYKQMNHEDKILFLDSALRRISQNTQDISPELKELLQKIVMNASYPSGKDGIGIYEGQKALTALASNTDLLGEILKDPQNGPAFLRHVLSNAFNTNDLLAITEPDLVAAGMSLENLIDQRKISEMPLCKRICDLAEKVINMKNSVHYPFIENSEDTPYSSIAATGNLRALFGIKAIEYCPKSKGLKTLKNNLVSILEGREQNLDGSPIPEDIKKWMEGQKIAFFKGNFPAATRSSPNIYARQFFPMLLAELKEDLTKDLKVYERALNGQRSLLEEMTQKHIQFQEKPNPQPNIKTGGSYLIAYSYGTSFLNMLPEQKDIKENRANLQIAYDKMVRLSDMNMPKPGTNPISPKDLSIEELCPQIPYYMDEEEKGDEKSSYGRNMPFYLGLYSGASLGFGKDKERYRKCLAHSTDIFFREFPNAAFYAKHNGAHMGVKGRAPYYFFANLPYYTDALTELIRTETDPKLKSKYSTMLQKSKEALLSAFSPEGIYNAGLTLEPNPTSLAGSNNPLENTFMTKDYNNAFVGLALLSNANECRVKDSLDSNKCPFGVCRQDNFENTPVKHGGGQ